MKKYIFILALLLLVGPVNAQRVVKYITFYPVPYGSHERLNVEEEFMVNMGNDMTSEVGGEVYIDGVSDFEGFLDISAGSGANTVSTGTIRSGNVSGSVYGTADLQGSTFITNVNTNNTLFSANVAGVSMLRSNTLVGGKSIANLLNCSSPSWRSLRVKGSEECKTYLTCGGSGDTGCAEPPAIICETNYCLDSTNTCRPKPSTTRSCLGNVPNSTGGTQTRSVSCSSGIGWAITLWSGTCTCASGYTWNASTGSCIYVNPCKISSCPSGQHLVNAGTERCCCENDTCGKQLAGGQIGYCRCSDSSFERYSDLDLRI